MLLTSPNDGDVVVRLDTRGDRVKNYEVVMPHTPLLTRIRGEYLEMPGMRLTFEQAQRLFGVDRTLCRMMLDALVEARFLCVKPDGAYARLIEGGDVLRPRPAKADRTARMRVELAS